MEVFLVIWLVCALLGLLIGQPKGKGGLGFLLGLFLGVIGLIIIAVAKPAEAAPQGTATDRIPCPHCAEAVLPAANVCPHCHRDLTPASMPPAPLDGTPEGWLQDPTGRHPDRWWDGSTWTHWVRDKPGGTRSEDPPYVRVLG